MNKNINSFMAGITWKISLILLFAITGISGAFADNQLKIDKFSVTPGETKVVPVILENSDPMTSFQFDVTLPTGLSCTAYKANADRLDRDQHSVMLTKLSETKWRVVILTVNDANIMGDSGTLLYLTIAGSSSFQAKGQLKIDRIVGTNVEAKKFDLDSSSVEVTPRVATVTTSQSAYLVKPDSSLSKIDVMLNNDVDIYGMQIDVALPEGLTMATKANGFYKFEYGDRIPQDATISAGKQTDGKIRILVSALSHQTFTGNIGTVFSFYVKGDKNLADSSKITFTNAVVSGPEDVAYDVDEVPTILVTNYLSTELTPFLDDVEFYTKAVNDTISRINAEFPDFKDSSFVKSGEADILVNIQNLKEGAVAAYDNFTMTENRAQLRALSDSIRASIGMFFESVLNAQVNLNDYDSLSNKIAIAEKRYSDAIAKIDTSYVNIKDLEIFVKAEKDIIDSLNVLRDRMKTSFEKGNMAGDMSILEGSCDDVNAAITKLLEDMRKYYAKVRIQYALVKTQIAAVSKLYDDALEQINSEYTDIKDQDSIVKAETEIATSLQALRDSAQASYNQGLIVDDKANLMAGCDSIKSAISKLLEDALKAHTIVGISELNSDNNVLVGIYTVSGIKVNVPVKGQINVFRFNDGKAKPVFVK